jgi:hypothetical protein
VNMAFAQKFVHIDDPCARAHHGAKSKNFFSTKLAFFVKFALLNAA